MLTSALTSALFDNEEFSIIADSDEFLKTCAGKGFNTLQLSKLTKLPKNSIVFSFSNDAAKSMFEISKNAVTKKSVFCATQVFDPTARAALYSLELLLASNLEQCLQTQRTVLNMLNSHREFRLSGNCANAVVVIHSHAQPYALLSEDLEGNFVQSVAELFEVHYAHMHPHEPCPFNVNGTVKISGILTVLRKPNPTLPSGLKTSLEWLLSRVAKEGATLSITNNTVTSFKIDEEEQLKLLDLAAGSRSLKLTEFAIGVNENIASNIDYAVNSQMNEGISGVHLAIGDGSSGFHIDFLSPLVQVSPLHQSDQGA